MPSKWFLSSWFAEWSVWYSTTMSTVLLNGGCVVWINEDGALVKWYWEEKDPTILEETPVTIYSVQQTSHMKRPGVKIEHPQYKDGD
jgi:hypothetical protein